MRTLVVLLIVGFLSFPALSWGEEELPPLNKEVVIEGAFSILSVVGEKVLQKENLPDQFTFISTDLNIDNATDAVDVQQVVNGVLGVPGSEPDNGFTTLDVNYDGARNAADVQHTVNVVLGVNQPPSVQLFADDPDFNFLVGQPVLFSASGAGGNWDLVKAGYFWFFPNTGPQWGTDQVPHTFTFPGTAYVLFSVVQKVNDTIYGLRQWAAVKVTVVAPI